MRLAVLASIILFMLGSCTGPVGCPHSSWYETGVSQGSDGEPASIIDDYEKVCERARSPTARDAWLAGWEEGHRQYCTPKVAYWIGRDRGDWVRTEICPAEVSVQLAEANEIGLKYYEIEEELAELYAEDDSETWAESFGFGLSVAALMLRRERYDIYPR